MISSSSGGHGLYGPDNDPFAGRLASAWESHWVRESNIETFVVEWTSDSFTVCTIVNTILITIQNARFNPEHSSDALYPPNKLRPLLYVPLLATNILATALICYKAWFVESILAALISLLILHAGCIAWISGFFPLLSAKSLPLVQAFHRLSESTAYLLYLLKPEFFISFYS